MRMEMSTQGHQSIIISDPARNVASMLMPAQHMYMEMSTDMKGPQKRGPDWRAYDRTNPCANVPDATCQKAGTGIADGRLCDKWQIVHSKTNITQTVWIDQKTGIPIRTESSDGSIFELLNIQEGPQSASLFEIPSDYHKFDMSQMMNMRQPEN